MTATFNTGEERPDDVEGIHLILSLAMSGRKRILLRRSKLLNF